MTILSRRTNQGTTFVELMIVLTLFSVLMYCVFLFVDRGITMYRESVDALEIRQQALVGLSHISDELRATSQASVLTASVPAPGLVFASLKDQDGAIAYDDSDPDETRRRPLWQKFVCYYLEDQADESKVIIRKEEPLATLVADPIPTPTSTSPVRDPLFFSTATLEKRLIARRVSEFTVKKETDLVEVKIEFNLSGRYDHKVEVQTKVLPRL